ncbi:LysM-like peptidoglycan-binding domain-containing protein [Providencia rettgeri]|uniref:LysM-like peptidoglycan-binding domain-containing protein n=1 Tax=Providencia rettgeri TaxID=587 RepID=UPI0034E0D6AD
MVKLSKFHIYSIAVLALIVVVALFWPTGDEPLNNTPQNQPIVIPPPTTPDITTAPIQTPSIQQPEGNTPQLPTEPEIVPEPIEPEPTEQPTVTPPQVQEPQTIRPAANEWQNYRVQKGKTLAQLFRDNHLQANDAFIMARVEGAEKPLSNLRQGQKIRLKANSKGEVQLLETTASDGKTYSFARLSDGSYYRTP